MARPKILISSTCYDLKESRNAIEMAIENLGYDAILSEEHDIFYDPHIHTHTACVKAVEESDIVVLIIGGRFGGEGVPEAFNMLGVEPDFGRAVKFAENFRDKKISITQLEILKAFELKVPVFTFVSQGIVSSHFFYEQNKNNPAFNTFIFPTIEKKETAPYIFEFINYIKRRENNNACIEFRDTVGLISDLKKQLSFYFQKLLKEERESVTAQIVVNPNYVHAEIVEHQSKERRTAFNELFVDIDTKDKINILGTGVTSFLSDEDHVEELLRKGNEIKILMVNDQITKKDWACSSKEFLERLNFAITRSSSKTFRELEAKTHCPLASLNFLVDTNHFNHYYAKENYVEKIIKSYELIKAYKRKIERNRWSGTLDVKHFNSFAPMSITAVFPDLRDQWKLLAEFIIPFTENRIMLKSSPTENQDIYRLFIDFFDETWRRAITINFDE